MIAFLRGKLIHKSPNQVVIDTGGVGYRAHIPLSTYVQLGEVNDPVSLHIHTQLTDSALSLYGFITREEKDLFLKLISISGIGPKLSLNILSGIGPRELEEAVNKNDIVRLAQVPGIGKKTALRIALEMQSKLDKKEKVLAFKGSPEAEDLLSALINLGFRRKEVEAVVEAVLKQAQAEAGFEKLLRECLKRLAKL